MNWCPHFNSTGNMCLLYYFPMRLPRNLIFLLFFYKCQLLCILIFSLECLFYISLTSALSFYYLFLSSFLSSFAIFLIFEINHEFWFLFLSFKIYAFKFSLSTAIAISPVFWYVVFSWLPISTEIFFFDLFKSILLNS